MGARAARACRALTTHPPPALSAPPPSNLNLPLPPLLSFRTSPWATRPSTPPRAPSRTSGGCRWRRSPHPEAYRCVPLDWRRPAASTPNACFSPLNTPSLPPTPRTPHASFTCSDAASKVKETVTGAAEDVKEGARDLTKVGAAQLPACLLQHGRFCAPGRLWSQCVCVPADRMHTSLACVAAQGERTKAHCVACPPRC